MFHQKQRLLANLNNNYSYCETTQIAAEG